MVVLLLHHERGTNPIVQKSPNTVNAQVCIYMYSVCEVKSTLYPHFSTHSTDISAL